MSLAVPGFCRSLMGRLVFFACAALPCLALAHGGPGPWARPLPQSPLVGLPPTYVAPGSLPPTYIPPGTLPPWAQQPPPASVMQMPPTPSPFVIPSDPGLNQRNLLGEELRLRGWQSDDGHRHENWRDDRGHDDRWNDDGGRRNFEHR